jgi:cell division septation protein DedD
MDARIKGNMMNHRNNATMMKRVMKKLRRGAAVGAALIALFMLFTGASVWEGAAAVSTGADLPESGYYVATNSFPRNTVVDITNLETGKTVRAIVATGLDSPGLLAILSREGAAVIGLQSRTVGRVRLIQPADPVALSSFGGRDFRSGDPDFDPEAALEAYGGMEAYRSEEAAAAPAEAAVKETPPPPPAWTEGPKYEPLYEPLPEPAVTAAVEEEDEDIEEVAAPETVNVEKTAPVVAETPSGSVPSGSVPSRDSGQKLPPNDNTWFIPNAEYTLRPAEERPPGYNGIPDSAYFIDPIETKGKSERSAETWTPERSGFGAPVLSRLESGKYYVQLGAYSKAEAVQREVNKLGRSYPVAVQNAGSADKPLYRVLIGPVNSGESGALLQRFRGGGYNDAFIRKGN